MFAGYTVLVTGGTGTFGNAVVRRCLAEDVKEIRVFSRDECKQEVMRDTLQDPRVKFFIGDTREYSSLLAPMQGVDFVFQAAALKQVPACEFFPLEAVRTNVLGSENVFNAAMACDVKKVIALSTDKAVYPINAMGISKAMMERLLCAKARVYSSPVFCTTRYGNVMASRGSVIPKLIDLILAGKPVTVTDPEMTRFMMTIDEAVDLVVYAFQNGKPGDLFVKKAPAATLLTLANSLKEIFNSKVDSSIIGTRHGEKLYETLVTREEMSKAEDRGDYFRVPMDARDMNYALYFSEGQKTAVTEYTSHNTHRMDQAETVKLLLTLDCVQKALR